VTRVLVLGGGFGGISTATELKRLLGDDVDIVLVDRREQFSMGLRKLWELVGHATIAEGSRSRALLEAHGIVVIQDTITSIDPVGRSTIVGGETLSADHLVVALGAEPRPDLVPGLLEHGHDVWSVDRVPAAAAALAAFERGRLLIAVTGLPYTCPPAPYECAMLVEERLRARGIRDAVELSVSTPPPILMPNAGAEGSSWLAARLDEKGIGHRTNAKVVRVDADRVVLEHDELPFDLLIGVPPHRVPQVVADAGLVGESGWVTVDPRRLTTAFPGVWALGDVAAFPLSNGLMLPKAGVMAEQQGAVVAAGIAADLRGDEQPDGFGGDGVCFIEMGTSLAALVDGRFYADPPQAELAPPSVEHAAAKRAFEADRLERWFGAV
jgi:sulfide:quinone oxidoreductase